MSATTPSRDDVEYAAKRLGYAVDGDVDVRVVLAHARSRSAFQRAPGGPSRTKTIQDDWSAEFYRRWRRVKGLVRETVVERDAFDLTDSSTSRTALDANDLDVQEGDPRWWSDYVADRRRGAVNAEPRNDFNFPTDAEKIDGFLDWLRSVFDDEVLEVRRRGPNGEAIRKSDWQEVYVRRAYGRGWTYANARLREAGVDVEGVDASEVFSKPIAAKTLSRLYTRVFRELEGITEAVGQHISRELTEGFAKGENPRKIARRITDRVDTVGETRARTLARTETINAHSEATLDRYEEDQGEDAEVTGRAEIRTAGDRRVCEVCEGLEGETYSVVEARGIIPIHPNCRCTWLPVID